MKCYKNNQPLSFRILSVQFLILILLCSPSCKSSKDPSVSEDQLITQIDSEESKRSEEEREAQILRDSIANLPQGFRYQENRSVDPNKPPMVLKFIDSLPKKEFKLSELANELEYIVVKTSIDSTLDHSFVNLEIGSKYIVYYGIQGIELFDIQGEHVKTVIRNQGIHISDGGLSGYGIKDLVGHPFMDITLNNNSFLYCLYDGPQALSSAMKVDPEIIKKKKVTIQEIPTQNPIIGSILKEFDASFIGKHGIHPLGNDMWATMDKKWNSATSGDLLTVYSPNGDTLCQFTDYDRILNFPGGPNRHTDREFCYNYRNTLTIKPAHNDTVFRLQPPNRLYPAYIFDFGNRKVSALEGAIPGNDLSEKNIAYKLHETNKYLFFYYSRNHIIYRNTSRGNYKYFYTVIDKRDNQIYQINMDDSLKGTITNDIDEGLPFWPDGVNEEGLPYMYVTGKEFKERSSKRIEGLEDNDILVILAK